MTSEIRMNYAAARVNRGLTQKEAADMLKINLKTLLNYEKGKTIPTWDRHEEMANLYNVPKELLCPPKK